jgi:hypothetical protein
MKFKIFKTSNYSNEEYKDFDTLEQAIDYGLTLCNASREIIVTKDTYNPSTDGYDKYHDCDYELEIYDDYRE